MISGPFGNSIVLTKEAWNHIQEGHPEMKGAEDAISYTLAHPDRVYGSSHEQHSHRDVYFTFGAHTSYPDLYTKVVVQNGEPSTVVSAWVTDIISTADKKGGLKYERSDDDTKPL